MISSSQSNSIKFKLVDYDDPQDSACLVEALSAYASDPMGGGKGLTEYAKANLPKALSELPHAFSILLFVDDKLAGLANCFEGFSTFACRKLVNIHDFVVLSGFRGRQLSQQLMDAVETEARKRDCCKLTLEVLEGNQVARKAYLKYGFENYELNPATGKALFMEKEL